jgi:putative acetyltransferase
MSSIMPVIRRERPEDVSAIHQLTLEAFENAAHTSHTEHLIVDGLRTAGVLTISLVAERDGRIVGHVALSPVEISDGSDRWFGLGPISVAPDQQRCGVGTLLMSQAIQELKGLQAAGCVLLGDPAYYRKFGFQPDPGLILAGVPAEYFQALQLDCATQPKGVVTYHSAFNS